MLKALFSSKTRVKLLKTFLLNPKDEYFIRELTRKLDEQINSIRRELDNLKKTGLLKSKMKNRKKYYHVNTDFIIFNELRDMVVKANATDTQLIKRVSKMGDIDLLILSGVFVGKESSVDLLLVGDINKNDLQEYLSEFNKRKEDIKFSLMTKKDFLYRVECNDKFIHDMLVSGENVTAINNLKKELNNLFAK